MCAIVYLEDVRATASRSPTSCAASREAKRPLVARQPDDPAAILFTSGSEGTPKGVVLSHRNMLANAAQAEARIDFGRRDKVFNVLPLFHSFGLTVGLILPLVCRRSRSISTRRPLHYRIVPELVYGDQRHHPVRHRHVPHRLRAHGASLRLPLAALHARRRRAGARRRPAAPIWKSSACAFSKATA